MIEILQEITEWDSPIHNGIYHVNGAGQLVAYQSGKGILTTFKKPMKLFSKSRRKFKKLGELPEALAADAVKVQGSNGKEYIIQGGKCSCPGFVFRGKCKHTAEAA